MSIPAASVPSEFRKDCASRLLELRNADGGWSYHAGAESRVEPTCWAIRALDEDSTENVPGEILPKSFAYLRSAQLADGSWPASPQIATGSWATSHACAVLARQQSSAPQVKAGLQWLCEDFPRDSSPLRRFVQKLRPGAGLNSHDDSLRGWGWTPRTASWVEPTAFALLALGVAPSPLLPSSSMERRKLAAALLYDRMCPAGGWNCGNPRVYGVDGEALVLPTCWALLALRAAAEKPGRALSLAWLQNNLAAIDSAGSLAVASCTLEHYGATAPAAKHRLNDWSANELAEQGTHVLAWACLAVNSDRRLFAPHAAAVAQAGAAR